jgi:hypothetical protein
MGAGSHQVFRGRCLAPEKPPHKIQQFPRQSRTHLQAAAVRNAIADFGISLDARLFLFGKLVPRDVVKILAHAGVRLAKVVRFGLFVKPVFQKQQRLLTRAVGLFFRLLT